MSRLKADGNIKKRLKGANWDDLLYLDAYAVPVVKKRFKYRLPFRLVAKKTS